MNKQLKLIMKIIIRGLESIINILLLPAYYLCGIFHKNKKIWIFCSWFGQRYSDNSRIFYEYINKFHPEIKSVWLSKNKVIIKKLRKEGKIAYHSYSVCGLWNSFRASKIFSTTGGEMSLFFCRNVEYYALWHGMPLKKILNDDVHFGGQKYYILSRKKIAFALRKIFPWKNFLEQKKLFTITNSDYFVQFLKTSFNLKEDKILRTGSPRCDALFFNKNDVLIEKIRNDFRECRIILYMPTFRTGAWTKEPFNPFEKKYFFDIKFFSDFLEQENLIFMYKPHYIDLELGFKKNICNRFFFITDESYNELYNFIGQIDILLTDYSSIYFDFISTKKDVILLPFDLEEYLITSRSHYFEYSELEGVKANNWIEFYEIVRRKKYFPICEEMRKKYAAFLDGKCCEKLWTIVGK